MHNYKIKIIKNHPRKTIYKFESAVPYTPNEGDTVVFPEDWKDGEWFVITSVHHYFVDRLIVVNVNPK